MLQSPFIIMIDDVYYMCVGVTFDYKNTVFEDCSAWIKIKNKDTFNSYKLTDNTNLINIVNSLNKQNLIGKPIGTKILKTELLQTGYFVNKIFKIDINYVSPLVNIQPPICNQQFIFN
jgi:hypothetical protein